MSFQKTVRGRQGFGLVGDVRLDSPNRASAFILTDGDRDLSDALKANIVGRACTYAQEQADETVPEDYMYATVGGKGVFCGVITSSKQYVSRGDLRIPLDSDGKLIEGAQNPLYIPAGSVVELMTMGHIVIEITNGAMSGDYLCFSQETGEFQAISYTPGTTPTAPSGYTLLENARVDRNWQLYTSGGLVLARFTY